MYINQTPDPKWMKVKFKYKSLIGLMLLTATCLSSIPIFFIIDYLATLLNIDGGRAFKGQEYGLEFSIIFIVSIFFLGVTNLFATYLAGRFNQWTFKKTIDVFWRNNYPDHWNK
jgi:hypothetical protein